MIAGFELKFLLNIVDKLLGDLVLSSGDLYDGELQMVRYAGTECSILRHGMITNINNSNKRIKLIKHCDVICGVEIR